MAGVLLGLATACDRVESTTLLLVDDACRCDHRSLELVAGLRVRLEGADSRSSPCIPQAQAQRLAALQQTLRGSTDLTDLGSGAYALTVVGYKDGACGGDVVACGYATFSLPAAAPAIDVPVRCQLDSGGDPATITEQACLEQTTPADRCTDQPGGGSELNDVQMLDGGKCDGTHIDSADSVAIALYDPTGALLLRRVCLSVPDTPQTLKVIQDSLPAPLLSQLTAGPYLLMVTGHDAKNCASDDVVACGGAKITIPTGSSPAVTMACHDDASPIDEAACLGSIK